MLETLSLLFLLFVLTIGAEKACLEVVFRVIIIIETHSYLRVFRRREILRD